MPLAMKLSSVSHSSLVAYLPLSTHLCCIFNDSLLVTCASSYTSSYFFSMIEEMNWVPLARCPIEQSSYLIEWSSAHTCHWTTFPNLVLISTYHKISTKATHFFYHVLTSNIFKPTLSSLTTTDKFTLAQKCNISLFISIIQCEKNLSNHKTSHWYPLTWWANYNFPHGWLV